MRETSLALPLICICLNWECLLIFAVYWHSDKLQYQRQCAEKISTIFSLIAKSQNITPQEADNRMRQWFEAFLYIFNMHWDKVDNFRIDKYLMFIRLHIYELLVFLKKRDYTTEVGNLKVLRNFLQLNKKEKLSFLSLLNLFLSSSRSCVQLIFIQDLDWFQNTVMQQVFKDDSAGSLVSKGIPLQVCDVFLQELNRSDSLNISLSNLSSMLDPFLKAIATCSNRILVNRILEKVFEPLLENNVTQPETSENEDSEDETYNYDATKGKTYDGGKMNPKTQKEVQKLVDLRFTFPNFNILLYAQDQIFKYASAFIHKRREQRVALCTIRQSFKTRARATREGADFYSQRMLINRARAFITKKMERRMRVHQQKRTKKMIFKLGNLISNQILSSSQLEEMREEANDLQSDNQDAVLHGFDEKQKILDLLNSQVQNGSRKMQPMILQQIMNMAPQVTRKSVLVHATPTEDKQSIIKGNGKSDKENNSNGKQINNGKAKTSFFDSDSDEEDEIIKINGNGNGNQKRKTKKRKAQRRRQRRLK
uniref:Uncharacterized protein n=1 Tax=Sterkiella nova TaxID=200597 RepID=Q9U4D7_STENO|nr:unknown protein [Sterkiella nova]